MNQFSNEISLDQIIGGRFSSLMKTDMKIPFIFTSDGWNKFVQNEIINSSVNPEREDWVIGKQQVHTSYGKFNSEKIRKDMTLMYINDFKRTWLQFLQSIRYYGFETVPLSANNLKMLSDPAGSPVIILLKLLRIRFKQL